MLHFTKSAIRVLRVAAATLLDCPLAVNEPHVSRIRSAAGRNYPATHCGLCAFVAGSGARRVVFGATTEVLFVPQA
jgi:hypothetical protein